MTSLTMTSLVVWRHLIDEGGEFVNAWLDVVEVQVEVDRRPRQWRQARTQQPIDL